MMLSKKLATVAKEWQACMLFKSEMLSPWSWYVRVSNLLIVCLRIHDGQSTDAKDRDEPQPASRSVSQIF